MLPNNSLIAWITTCTFGSLDPDTTKEAPLAAQSSLAALSKCATSTLAPPTVATPAFVSTILLLRAYEDEQNVIMTFNKPVGQTSYGFLIPNTVSPEITNNINTLQAAVQSQLLSNPTNPGIEAINGGTFG